MRHGPRRLRPGRCRCGLPLTECLVERAINAPGLVKYDLGQEHARAMQRERDRWWARGAR